MNKQEALEVLDGLLLGDAGLYRQTKDASFSTGLSKPFVPRAQVTKQIREDSLKEHMKYLRWITYNAFSPLGIWPCKGHPKLQEGISKGIPYQYAHLRTLQSPLLGEYFDEWYSGGHEVVRVYNNTTGERTGCNKSTCGAIKRLPERIMQASVLSPLSLAHFFLNDGGNTSFSYEGHYTSSLQVTLSTHNFLEPEVMHIVEMLSNMGVKGIAVAWSKKVKKGSGLYLKLPQGSINNLIDLIESHILEIFGDSVGPSYKDMIKRRG